jgi:hypothetical protein
MKRTVAQAKKNLEEIQAFNKKKLADLDVIYYDRLEKKLDLTQIKKDIAQAQTIADRAETLAERSLAQAERDELLVAQEAERKATAIADEVNSKMKARAQREFVERGGSSSEFENAWPQLRQKLIEQAVTERVAAPEERAPIIGSI